ncbi:MAG: hypothetical protein C0594_11795 [Marinilabiliales bacterium]|nr:MAG: hypothetical protein C0594_11795 [Marinilabiliales bacterium]
MRRIVVFLVLMMLCLSSLSYAQKEKSTKTLRIMGTNTPVVKEKVVEKELGSYVIVKEIESFPKLYFTGDIESDLNKFKHSREAWIENHPNDYKKIKELKVSIDPDPALLKELQEETEERASVVEEIRISELSHYPVLKENASKEDKQKFEQDVEFWKTNYPDEYNKTLGKRIVK